ncbi:autotransporter assembly complex protein TamA [Parashewanella tropica]|uniref:autotransporter assembly complex protein TamA n=1 Tax=Parashewanella tropica TaxID=2547970 RepID=UPI001FEC6CC6|nr:autotransporter assembly complex family protein [Parashewanella tropica]
MAFPTLGKGNDFIDVEISGVNSSLTKNIEAHLGPLPTSKTLRRAYIFNAESKIREAMESRGYYHSQIKTDIKKGIWKFHVQVAEGKPTLISNLDIHVTGEMQRDPDYLLWRSKIQLKTNQQLNHGTYEDVKSSLASLALDNGYFDATYTKSQILVDRKANTASISLYLDSGTRYYFGDIKFTGQTLTDEVMQKLIPFPKNTPYSSHWLSEFNKELSTTGYFSSIKVLPQLHHAKDYKVPLKVELSNKDKNIIELGLGADIGTSSERDIDPRIRVSWGMPQINKYGHSQFTTTEWSPERPKFLTTYMIPLTHPINDQLQLQVGLQQDKYGVVQDFDKDEKRFRTKNKLEATQYLFGVGRQRKFKSLWVLNYSVQTLASKYTQQNINYKPRYLLFNLAWSKTVKDEITPLDPEFGFRQSYSIEHANTALGSTISLTRIQAQFKWIFTPWDRHRFVSRVDLGVNIAKSADLPKIAPSLRYFAGGDQSIRGYGYQELGPYIDYTDSTGLHRQVIGGRYLAVASTEYQYYVTPTWRVATFVDAGNALDTSQLKPIISTGAGLHWISPIGPIRLDLATGLNKTNTVARSWRIHLTMGAEL